MTAYLRLTPCLECLLDSLPVLAILLEGHDEELVFVLGPAALLQAWLLLNGCYRRYTKKERLGSLGWRLTVCSVDCLCACCCARKKMS